MGPSLNKIIHYLNIYMVNKMNQDGKMKREDNISDEKFWKLDLTEETRLKMVSIHCEIFKVFLKQFQCRFKSKEFDSNKRKRGRIIVTRAEM